MMVRHMPKRRNVANKVAVLMMYARCLQCADGSCAQEAQGKGECPGQRQDLLMVRQRGSWRVSTYLLSVFSSNYLGATGLQLHIGSLAPAPVVPSVASEACC